LEQMEITLTVRREEEGKVNNTRIMTEMGREGTLAVLNCTVTGKVPVT